MVNQTVGFELLSGRDVYEDPYKLVDLIGSVKGKNENHTKNKDQC